MSFTLRPVPITQIRSERRDENNPCLHRKSKPGHRTRRQSVKLTELPHLFVSPCPCVSLQVTTPNPNNQAGRNSVLNNKSTFCVRVLIKKVKR